MSADWETEPMDISYTVNNTETVNNVTVTLEHNSPNHSGSDNNILAECASRTPTLTPGMTFADAVRSPVVSAACQHQQPLSQINHTPPSQPVGSIPGYLKMTKASNSKRNKPPK